MLPVVEYASVVRDGYVEKVLQTLQKMCRKRFTNYYKRSIAKQPAVL